MGVRRCCSNASVLQQYFLKDSIGFVKGEGFPWPGNIDFLKDSTRTGVAPALPAPRVKIDVL